MYVCPPMPPAPCPPDCPPSKPVDDASSRYFREIGTTMIGNQLIIRMEREKGKSKKLRGWDPPCDCDVVEIQRPTGTEGPKILKGVDNNRILFRVEPKSTIASKDNDVSLTQAVSYEVGQCKGGLNTNDQCRTFTIYPILNGSGAQEVHMDRLTDAKDNIFFLRVKRKSDSEEQPKRNIEVEMRTPKPPELPQEQTEEQQRPEQKVGFTGTEDCEAVIEKYKPKTEKTEKKKGRKKKKKR